MKNLEFVSIFYICGSPGWLNKKIQLYYSNYTKNTTVFKKVGLNSVSFFIDFSSSVICGIAI